MLICLTKTITKINAFTVHKYGYIVELWPICLWTNVHALHQNYPVVADQTMLWADWVLNLVGGLVVDGVYTVLLSVYLPHTLRTSSTCTVYMYILYVCIHQTLVGLKFHSWRLVFGKIQYIGAALQYCTIHRCDVVVWLATHSFPCMNIVFYDACLHYSGSYLTGSFLQEVQHKQWCVELRYADVWDMVTWKEAVS